MWPYIAKTRSPNTRVYVLIASATGCMNDRGNDCASSRITTLLASECSLRHFDGRLEKHRFKQLHICCHHYRSIPVLGCKSGSFIYHFVRHHTVMLDHILRPEYFTQHLSSLHYDACKRYRYYDPLLAMPTRMIDSPYDRRDRLASRLVGTVSSNTPGVIALLSSHIRCTSLLSRLTTLGADDEKKPMYLSKRSLRSTILL